VLSLCFTLIYLHIRALLYLSHYTRQGVGVDTRWTINAEHVNPLYAEFALIIPIWYKSSAASSNKNSSSINSDHLPSQVLTLSGRQLVRYMRRCCLNEPSYLHRKYVCFSHLFRRSDMPYWKLLLQIPQHSRTHFGRQITEHFGVNQPGRAVKLIRKVPVKFG
jgi:hypothetical protein